MGKKSKFKDFFLFDYIYYFHSLNNTKQKQVTSCNPQYQYHYVYTVNFDYVN